jgi:ATP-dependent DNA helicase RecQ
MVATSAFGMGIDKPNIRYVIHYHAPGSLEQYVQEAGRAGRDGRPANCSLLFDEADLDIQERLQAAGRPSVWHLARLETALAAWADEARAPTAAALALSAGVPIRTSDTLLSELDTFRAGPGELVAKLKRSRHEGTRRLAAVADYARSEECRSVSLRRYFGEEHPPPCGTCDRCRAGLAAATQARVSRSGQFGHRRHSQAPTARSARARS